MPSSKKHLLIQSLSWVWTCIKDGWCLNWRFCDWLSCCLLVFISNIFFRVFNIFVCDLPWLLNSWQNNWKANWWRRNSNWRNSCLTSFFKLAACLASSRNHQWLGIFRFIEVDCSAQYLYSFKASYEVSYKASLMFCFDYTVL